MRHVPTHPILFSENAIFIHPIKHHPSLHYSAPPSPTTVHTTLSPNQNHSYRTQTVHKNMNLVLSIRLPLGLACLLSSTSAAPTAAWPAIQYDGCPSHDPVCGGDGDYQAGPHCFSVGNERTTISVPDSGAHSLLVEIKYDLKTTPTDLVIVHEASSTTLIGSFVEDQVDSTSANVTFTTLDDTQPDDEYSIYYRPYNFTYSGGCGHTSSVFTSSPSMPAPSSISFVKAPAPSFRSKFDARPKTEVAHSLESQQQISDSTTPPYFLFASTIKNATTDTLRMTKRLPTYITEEVLSGET